MSLCEQIVNEIEQEENKEKILKNLKITNAQWDLWVGSIRRIEDDKICKIKGGLKENHWTFIIACAYTIDDNGCHLLQELFFKNLETENNSPFLWFQYSVYTVKGPSGRGGKAKSTPEFAFGNVININKTELEYLPPEKGEGWVGFVEMKTLDDIKTNSTDNPIYNQLVKYIKNALTIQTFGADEKKYPENVFLTLVTPKRFRDNRNSRLYGYKYDEYTGSDKDKKMIDDIPDSVRHEFSNENWKSLTKSEVERRLNLLKLNWVSFEDIFSNMPEGKIKDCINNILELEQNTLFEK